MSNTYGFGPTSVGYGGYGSPADQAARLAQAQLAEGSASTPIRSKWQGAARLANALMGGLGARQVMQGSQDSNAAALKLAQSIGGGGGGAVGGGGLPAAPGALADLENDPSIMQGVSNAATNGLPDSATIGQSLRMGPTPQQMGPSMPAMAPNNAAGGVNPGGPFPGGALPAGGAGGGVGSGSMLGMNTPPPQGIQVASNDPNFMPSFPQPSADKGQTANGFSPEDLDMFQKDMQAVPGAPQGGAISQPPQAGGTLGQLEANIAQTESGGNYGAQGPATKSGDHAYGKYQVMGANIPQWTQQVLGQSLTTQQFLASPQAQEAVANAKLGGMLAKDGPAGAAREWFTGSPTGTGSDGNMNADKYAALATRGMGGDAFLQNSVAGPGAPSSIIGSPPPPQNDQQMFQQDQQPAQGDQGGQGSGIPPETMAGIRAILMNPYASPEAKQMATGLMQRYIQPQWETVNRPDGSVIAINKNNPQQNRMIAQPVRPSTFTQIGVDGSGNPRYGFVNPASGQITPADAQGSGASPYVPRTVGAPPPGQLAPQGSLAPNIPTPNPAWTPQPARGGQPQPQGAAQAPKPNSIATPDYTVKRTPGEDAIDAMAAKDPNPANAQLYTRARNIMLGNEPAPVIGVAGTKPVDIATMNVVRQADPNFNPAVATQRAEVIKSWQDKTTPTSAGGQLLAANTSLKHMGGLADASDALNPLEGNSQVLNHARGWMASNVPGIPGSGGTDLAAKRAAYEAALQPVTEELTKLYSGGPGAEGDRERMISQLSPDAPPAVRAAAMKTLTGLLAGKVQSLQNQWSQAGFAAPFPALDTDSQAAMQRFLGNGQQGQPPGQPQASGGPPEITEQQYNQLPPGALYRIPGNPKVMRKP